MKRDERPTKASKPPGDVTIPHGTRAVERRERATERGYAQPATELEVRAVERRSQKRTAVLRSRVRVDTP